jgi:hypothetical protein
VTGTTMLLGAAAILWLLAAWRFPRQAVWLLLLWVPVQGWVQLNVFNDSSATVLIYEFLIIGLYLGFAARWLGSPGTFGPPPVIWLALPFVVWTLLLAPRSVEEHGTLLTLVGLRTYLLPLPLVWIGYRTFETRREVENVGWLIMLQLAVIAGVAALQFAGVTSMSGSIFEVPAGFGVSGVLRPPGTFSAAGHYGMYILLSIPLAFGLLALRVPAWKRLCFGIGLAGATIGLMVNTQRATIVLLAVILPFILMLARRRRAVAHAVIAFTVVAAGSVIGAQVAGQAFIYRVGSIAGDARNTLIDIPSERFSDALRTPLLGGGLGIASPGIGRLIAPAFTRRTLDVISIKPAEAFMAALVYQTGVPGLVLFYLFIAALLHLGLQAARACRRTDMGLLAAAIFGFEVAICLQSWSYDPLHYPPSRVMFWVWAGVLLSLPRLAGTAAMPEPAAMPRRAPVPMRRLVRPQPPSTERPRRVMSSHRR